MLQFWERRNRQNISSSGSLDDTEVSYRRDFLSTEPRLKIFESNYSVRLTFEFALD